MPDLVKLFLEDVEGRELMTEALQYAMKLVIAIHPDQRDNISRTYSSLSQGRKVFRLFRFIPEAQKALATPKSDDLDSRLDTLKHAASAIFYAFDHYVWIVQFALQSSRDKVASVKRWKHQASLLVSVLTVLIHIRKISAIIKETNTVDLSNAELRKDLVKVMHHALRLLLSIHKMEIVVDRKREWSDFKSGALGLTSAVLGMLNRAISN